MARPPNPAGDRSPATPRVLLATDKLRGTLSAPAAAAALAEGFAALGLSPVPLPLSDGGEGFLEVLGGATRRTPTVDAFGEPIEAAWRLRDGVAVIESALVIGYSEAPALTPGAARAANSAGLGRVIATALRAGAEQVLVGLGGTVTSDGGRGALAELADLVPFPPGVVLAATDVTTDYLDAAAVYGPQKGADPSAVAALSAELARTADTLRARFGRDVTAVPGGGAAGGLGGMLWAAGAEVVSGFDTVTTRVGLAAQIDAATWVISGEGYLDDTSFTGKVVGRVVAAARVAGKPIAVVAGRVAPSVRDAHPELIALDLSEVFGTDRAWRETADCLRAAAAELRTALGDDCDVCGS